MRQPSIDTLLSIVDNKYALVVIAAKRARQITDERNCSKVEEDEDLIKPVTQALIEIAEGKVGFKFPEKKKIS